MTDKKQIDKFREAAKELECNESEKDFDRKLSAIVKKPLDSSPKNKND